MTSLNLKGRVDFAELGPMLDGCDADLNHDGVMSDGQDMNVLRQMWGTSDADADLNGDGIVNILDLAVFRMLSQ